jgi:hypothetical protein
LELINVWHKNYNKEKDLFCCHTDDGGTTWQGPMPVTGRSITEAVIEYAYAKAGTDVANVTGWDKIKPSFSTIPIGYNLYTRTYNTYNIGSASDATYTIEIGRTGRVELSRYSSSISAGPNGEIDTNGDLLKNASLVTVYVFDDEKEEEEDKNVTSSEDLEFEWYCTGGTLATDGDTTATQKYLASMNSEGASITVKVRCGTMELGTQTFVISKNRQGP